MSSVVARAHPGSIVKITNAPVPYNIVGILNDDGKAFIPHVPINTKVTFSIYDPVSGLYDPDAGTYTTGSVPGGFDRPMLLFRPPTGKRTFTLDVGSVMHDSVSLDWQRIDYRLHIGGADTSKLFNIGFSATNRLALRIQDPDGKAIFDNADLACYASAHLRFSTAGDYLIRVSYGVGGQAGSFDLGVSVSPVPPLPSSCLCGEITADTLFEELAPYDVTCAAAVPASDTLSIEPDVTIRFEPGGTLTSSGVLVGTGTDLTPIRLRMFDPESPQRSEPTTQILKPGPSIGKEEKP